MFTSTPIDAVERANASGRQPVVFIHGLWLKRETWEPWVRLFEGAGYTALAPGWPVENDGVGVESIGQVVEHHAGIIRSLDRRPILVGHSFGGLIAQIIAGQGLAEATVAISPAPFRGVLPLPVSAVRSAWPVLRRPGNAHKRVSLTPDQFRYAFGNTLAEAESDALHEAFHQSAPGLPIFQAALANFNPWTEARVATQAANRGPMLMIAGEQDHTVPPAVVRAAYNLQRRNRLALTELTQMPRRGHSLTIDRGWQDAADLTLSFLNRLGSC